MDNYQIFCTIISICSLLIATSVAIRQHKDSKKNHEFQTEQLEVNYRNMELHETQYIDQIKPNPMIKKVELIKKTANCTEQMAYHRRYWYGSYKQEYDLPENKCIELTNEYTIEKLKSHINTAYFTKNEQGTDCIVLNFLKDMKHLVIYENPKTLITLINMGAPYKRMELDATRITYTLNGTVVILRGAEQNFTRGLASSETHELYFCEATNKFENSVCSMDYSDYKTLPERVDILGEMYSDQKYFLNYTKLEFFVTVTNYNDRAFYFKMWLEKVGNSIKPDTKSLETRADLNA